MVYCSITCDSRAAPKAPAPETVSVTIDGKVHQFPKGTNLLGSTQGTKAELEDVVYWVSKGKIKPVVDTVLPFSDMVKGHVMMAEAQQFGKILTTPQKL